MYLKNIIEIQTDNSLGTGLLIPLMNKKNFMILTCSHCIKQKDGILTKIDLDYCKGCGICSKVCPFRAIDMKEKEDEI